jgi:hypothetical protein
MDSMRFSSLDRLVKFFSSHRKKALFGVGLIPVVYVAWKKRGAIRKGVGNLKTFTSQRAESGPSARKMSESRKTDMVNTVRFMLSRYDTESFSIIYDRDRRRGRMGYHVRTSAGPALFFGWSEEYEALYPQTPFWIELDAEATKAFADRGLKIHHDIYPNPNDNHSIIISLTLDEMEDPRTAAGKVADLSRKILL